MLRKIHTGGLLAGVMGLVLAMTASMPAAAQRHRRLHQITHNKLTHRLPRKAAFRRADVAITYTGEAAKLAAPPGSRFWLNGGSVDGAVTFYGDLGLAANFSAVHSQDISDGVGLGKTSFVIGPRYTKDTSKWTSKWRLMKKAPSSALFGEALFGVAHGFDGQFPSGSSLVASATSPAIQLGVGADVTLWKSFGARVFELDYIHTGLPNNGSNSQNDLRLSFGVSYRLKPR